MRGDSVHLAPLGLSGMSIRHALSFFLGTTIWKAIELPSGDQRMFDGDSITRVIWLAAPSSGTTTQLWPTDLPWIHAVESSESMRRLNIVLANSYHVVYADSEVV